MPKLPYFPFYPDDWLSSLKIMNLSWAQRGIYMHLLAWSWKHPGVKIPGDRKSLQRLCPKAKWTDIDKVVEECFDIAAQDGSWLSNGRLADVWRTALVKHEKAKESANCRWNKEKQHANAMRTQCERNANQNQNQNQNQTVSKDKVKDTVDKTPKPRFIQPTLEEVKSYCLERRNAVDPERWMSHYTSNGWKVGRNPMKDWKAAVRTWEKSDGFQGGSGRGPGRESAFEKRSRLAREAKEQAASALGIRRGSPGLLADVYSDATEQRRPGTVDNPVIDGTCVEVPKAR